MDTQNLKKEGVQLLVYGEIREGLSSQCDFPLYIRDSIQEYSEFDFKMIQESIDKYGEFFIADYLDNQDSVNQMIDLSKQINESTSKKQIGQMYIDILKNGFLNDNYLESYVNIYTRVKKFKKYIAEFVREKNIKDGELIIVAHSNFSRSWTAEGMDYENQEYINYYHPKNCEIFESEI